MAKAEVPHPLPDPLVELVAERFRVLGEPMRIKLMDRLRDGAASVSELQEAVGASQQNVANRKAAHVFRRTLRAPSIDPKAG